MKVDQERNIRLMLQEAKLFVANFDEIVSKLTEAEAKSYRRIISKDR